jgi:hypothetical protein
MGSERLFVSPSLDYQHAARRRVIQSDCIEETSLVSFRTGSDRWRIGKELTYI